MFGLMDVPHSSNHLDHFMHYVDIIIENIKHIWSFFESGHGKGEHDGARACIKHAL